MHESSPWVEMEIDPGYFGCGGSKVYFTLTLGNHHCSSDIIQEFDLGSILVWKHKALGDCDKFIRKYMKNQNTKAILKLVYLSQDSFCPTSFEIHPQKGVLFHYDMKKEWYSSSTNEYEHFPNFDSKKDSFSIDSEILDFPSHSEKYEDEKLFISYYKWVEYVMFVQGLLFCFPHLIWKKYENDTIKNIISDCFGECSVQNSGLKQTNVINDFKDSLAKREKKTDLIISVKEKIKEKSWYAKTFLLCLLMNLINVIVQAFLINKFLAGVFFRVGLNVFYWHANFYEEGRTDPMLNVFPRQSTFLPNT